VTRAELDRAKELEAAATPGPWVMGRHQALSKDEMIAYVINCIEVSPVQDQFYLIGKDDWSVDIAHTGNGATSANNAAFISKARTLVPALVAEVERLRRALAESLVMIDKLSDGEHREEATKAMDVTSWAEVEEAAKE